MPVPVSVGRYEVLRRLATGGMADVFLAVDRGPHALDRLCVVKRMLPALATEPDTLEMFLREARIVARIRHPNVVQIHELGEQDGLPFLAMQYVEGITLQELLQAVRAAEGARLSAAAVLHLLDQAAAGLHAAHELVDPSGQPYHLVHRDVSPHNLMVDVHAHVTLLDFGIAKDNRPEPGHDATRRGLLKGKIAYMSPEQARQEALDRRSDVFALGIVAYELFTLRKPFRGSSDLALLHAMVHGDRARLEDLRPDLPRSIVAVVDRALAIRKDERWPTAEAFRQALWDAGRSMGVDIDRAEVAESLKAFVAARKEDRDQDDPTHVSGQVSGPKGPATGSSGRRLAKTFGGDSTTASRTATGLALGLGGVGVVFGGLGVGALALAALLVGGAAAAAGAAWWWLAGGDSDAVVIAVAPVMDPEVLAREHAPVEAFLEPRLGRGVTFDVAPDYGSAAREVVEGLAPFALLPEGTVRVARQQAPALHLVAIKEIDGRTAVDAVLVARVTSGLSGDAPDGFRGKTVCFTDPRSSSGHRFPKRWFEERGLDPDRDLVLHVSGSHEQVVRDLAAGVCEVGATHAGNLDTAHVDRTLGPEWQPVAVTGVTRHDVLVAGPGTDPVLVDRLRELLLKYDPSRDALGSDGSITGWRPVPPEYAGPE